MLERGSSGGSFFSVLGMKTMMTHSGQYRFFRVTCGLTFLCHLSSHAFCGGTEKEGSPCLLPDTNSSPPRKHIRITRCRTTVYVLRPNNAVSHPTPPQKAPSQNSFHVLYSLRFLNTSPHHGSVWVLHISHGGFPWHCFFPFVALNRVRNIPASGRGVHVCGNINMV